MCSRQTSYSSRRFRILLYRAPGNFHGCTRRVSRGPRKASVKLCDETVEVRPLGPKLAVDRSAATEYRSRARSRCDADSADQPAVYRGPSTPVWRTRAFGGNPGLAAVPPRPRCRRVWKRRLVAAVYGEMAVRTRRLAMPIRAAIPVEECRSHGVGDQGRSRLR